MNRYVSNLPPMPGVFPDYPAPVVRNADHGTELTGAAILLVWTLRSTPKNKLLTDKDCYEVFERMFARRLAHEPPHFSLSPEEESDFKACEPTDR